MDLFGRMDFETSVRDPRGRKRGAVVLKVPEPEERIFHYEPRKPVEREKAVGAVAQIRHRKAGNFRGGDGLGKRMEIAAVGDV